MNDQVKTRHTFEEWARKNLDYSAPVSAEVLETIEAECNKTWNAALASVIMPETMDLSKVWRYTVDYDIMRPDPSGRWVEYDEIDGKIAVWEGAFSLADMELMWGHGKRQMSLKEALEMFDKPTPVPSVGGLTRDNLSTMAQPYMSWQHAFDNVWEAILADRAATEARVRRDVENEKQTEISSLNLEIMDLRAQLAAKPTGIEIPNPKVWPKDADGIEVHFVKDWLNTWKGLGEIAYIPRPQPINLTREEMAEAWKLWWSAKPEARVYHGNAKDALLEELLKGQSIESLCEAAGIPTTRNE
jgi:hypothetical protein